MKYVDLKQKLKDIRVFSTQDILLWDENFRLANLDRWEDEGKIIQLKRGWYVFGDINLTEYDLWLISNRIYQPSYVSLESALSYKDIINEKLSSTRLTKYVEIFNRARINRLTQLLNQYLR